MGLCGGRPTGNVVAGIRSATLRVPTDSQSVSRMLRLAMAALALMFGLSSGPPSGRLAADELVLDTCSKAQLATLGPAHCYFTDVTLRDHYGQEKRLYSDLLKGKVVVVSSFFTSCVNSCPIVNALLAALQDELGAQFGTKVHFLTITADPVLDTPRFSPGMRAAFPLGRAGTS